MQKVAAILVLFLAVTGCSIIKKGRSPNMQNLNALPKGDLINDTEKQNVTREGFFIPKAEIIVSELEGSEKLLASIKYKTPDEYLISIRNKTGIEAARIYISEDTILVNDRINKNLYYGSTFYLEEKYGISTALLPLIFGDYVGKMYPELNTHECIKGIVSIKGIISGIIISYNISCSNAKVINAVTQNNKGDRGIEFSFKEFLKKEQFIMPGLIEIKDIQRMTSIKIEIRKLETHWAGVLEFIPGSRYDKIKLQ